MQTAWPSLGSALEMPWLALGGPLLSSWVEKTVLSPGTVPISGREAFIPVWQLPAECHDYCKLVNGWVWFEL